MSKYTEKLKEAGVSESRIFSLELAVNQLHSQLCKLDLKGRRAFLHAGLDQQISDYANLEEMANPVEELRESRIQRCIYRIDTDEFDMCELIEKWKNAITDMWELGLPGASELMHSLDTIWNLTFNEKKEGIIQKLRSFCYKKKPAITRK